MAPWNVQHLSPPKLAAFYRLVGGDYDLLFLQTPPASLSFIYKSLGCYHSLQPVSDPFAPPSIPALTPEGFVRWQTIQLLLGPAEHVPILQAAVKRFDIIHPASREPFPKNLPTEALPSRPDPHMTRWHEEVMDKEFGRGVQQRLERRKSKSAEERECTTDSSDDTSIGDSAEYSKRRRKPDNLGADRHRRAHTISPREHRTHNVNGGRSPSHHHHRRQSMPENDPARGRDGPTPTDRSHRRHSPQVLRPPTPGLLSITSGSETADESFTSTSSTSHTSPKTQNKPSFHHGPRPYFDKHGRRHSAHSPYNERDHVPIPQSNPRNMLSPPFFASHAPLPPTIHQRPSYNTQHERPRSGSRVRWRDEKVFAMASNSTTPSAAPPIIRYEGQQSYSDDRPRRRPTDTARGIGARRYHDGSGWE